MPRFQAYGTFPRFLGHYARDLGLVKLPEMVAHLTSRPAKRIGIYPHRGLLAQGSAADLVLFHPETFMDKATYDQPKLRAEGIRFVLVNGEVAMDEGQLTGMRAGRTLRRSKDGNVTTVTAGAATRSQA
jgi:N-acyl-D-aspartate/D-glutamate deacylase